MRLRRNFKRTAAAALALSMAVSAATPAMAGYKIDMSKVSGDVEIKQEDDGNGNAKVTIKVGDNVYDKDNKLDGIEETDDEDITVTGDNTKPTSTTSTLEAPEENAAPVDEPLDKNEPLDENEDEVTYGDTEDAADPEPEDPYAFSTMDLTPEDYGFAAADPADPEADASETKEPARTVTETEQGTVISYEDYDVDPDVQVTMPEAKTEAPAEQPAADKSDDKAISTQESKSENSFAKVFAETARNVIKIINNSTNELKITLKDLTIDAGTRYANAMEINGSGTGGVTLELDGKNTLSGGSGGEPHGTPWIYGQKACGIESKLQGTLKITDSNQDGTLEAKGGDVSNYYGGYGIHSTSSTDLILDHVDIKATGGSSGDGVYVEGAVNVLDSTLVAQGGDAGDASYSSEGGTGFQMNSGNITNSTIIAKGGDSSKQTYARGGDGFGVSGETVVSNSHISAVGGKAESITNRACGGEGATFNHGPIEIDGGTLYAKGGDAFSKEGEAIGGTGVSRNSRTSTYSGNILVVGGDADTETGTATGGDAFYRHYYYVSSPYGNAGTLTSGTFAAIAGKGKTKNGKFFNSTDGSGDKSQPLTITDGANFYLFGVGDTEFTVDSKRLSNSTGTITYYKNAKLTPNEDGSTTLTGDVFKREANGQPDDLANAPAEVELNLAHDWEEHGTYRKCTICNREEQYPQPDPVAPEENSSDGIAALELRVLDADKLDMPFAVSQSGAVRTYTASADTATLTGSMETLSYLKEHGAETIVFATNQQTTSFAIDDVLAQGTGNATFYLTHTGAEEAQMLVVE